MSTRQPRMLGLLVLFVLVGAAVGAEKRSATFADSQLPTIGAQAATPKDISQATPKLGFVLRKSESDNRVFSMAQISVPGFPGLECEIWCYEGPFDRGDGVVQPDGSLVITHTGNGVKATSLFVPRAGAVDWTVTVEGADPSAVRKITGVNACFQFQRSELLGNRGKYTEDFVLRCFIITEKGLTLFRDTVRFPDTRYPRDHEYNTPPYVQNFVPIWDTHPGQPKDFWGNSTDRPAYSLIGVVSRDGKYLVAEAWRKSNSLCEGWHDCLHCNPDMTLDFDPTTGRTVTRGKIYFMANDPAKLLAAYRRDFEPWHESLRVEKSADSDALTVTSTGATLSPQTLDFDIEPTWPNPGGVISGWSRTLTGAWTSKGAVGGVRWQFWARPFQDQVNLYVTLHNGTNQTVSPVIRSALRPDSDVKDAERESVRLVWEGERQEGDRPSFADHGRAAVPAKLGTVPFDAAKQELRRTIPEIAPGKQVTIRGRAYLATESRQRLDARIQRDLREWAAAVPFQMLMDAEQESGRQQPVPETKNRSSGVQVPFHVENELALSHPGLTVKGGVPFARGQVRPEDRLFVTDTDGVEIPAQVKVTGFWPDGSIKWALVTLTTPLEANGRREFLLKAEKQAAGMTPKQAIASEDGDAIHVNTGRIEFTVSKRHANLFDCLALVDGTRRTPVIGGKEGAGLFVEIASGDPQAGKCLLFDANREGAPFAATLEEAGPQRAVICLRGEHVSTDGQRFGNYTVRIYAHAQSSQLRLVHSFIYTGDPQKDFVRSIGLRVRPALSALQSYALSGERGCGIVTEHNQNENYPIWQKAVLSQDSPLHYSMQKWINVSGNRGLTISQGGRSQGWGDISGDPATVTVAIRNFWQESPKAIEIDAQRGELTAYLYSPYGEPLDMRRHSDLIYCAQYESPAGGPDSPTVPFEQKYGGRYIGKTSELLLDFRAKGDREQSARDALFFQSPPLLTADMAWIGKTGVFGQFAAASQNVDFEATARVKELSDFLLHEQQYRKWYSFMDYGDVVHSYDPQRDLWRFDEGGYAWNNNETMIDEAMWNAYLHTGDPRLFRLAEAMTRHTSDVDMYQMGPMAGCGNRHNVTHRGCTDKERRMTVPAHKRVYYFLTGDEHIRDQVKLIYDTICDESLVKGSMDIGVGGYAAIFLWETTGEARYGEIVRKAAQVFCSARIGGKGFPNMVEFDFRTGNGKAYDGKEREPQSGWFLFLYGPMYFLVDAAELTGDPAVRDALVEWAELLHLPDAEFAKHQPHTSGGGERYLETMRAIAYVYRQTKDPRYLAMIKTGLKMRSGHFVTLGGPSPLEVEEHPAYRFERKPGRFERGHIYQLSQSLLPIPYGLAALGP